MCGILIVGARSAENAALAHKMYTHAMTTAVSDDFLDLIATMLLDGGGTELADLFVYTYLCNYGFGCRNAQCSGRRTASSYRMWFVP
jgi:hypothetical protein